MLIRGTSEIVSELPVAEAEGDTTLIERTESQIEDEVNTTQAPPATTDGTDSGRFEN